MSVSDPGRAEGKVKLNWLVLECYPQVAQASVNHGAWEAGGAQELTAAVEGGGLVEKGIWYWRLWAEDNYFWMCGDTMGELQIWWFSR